MTLPWLLQSIRFKRKNNFYHNMTLLEQNLNRMSHKKRVFFTNDTDIRLGFEVECVIRGNRGGNWPSPNWTKFCKEIYDLKKNVVIGDDCSINRGSFGSNARTAEVRTAPLPPKNAMRVLKAIFNCVNKYGATNSSCGLHVNISSIQREKMLRFNPLPFLSSRLWDELLKTFKRTGNQYCRINVNKPTPKTCKVHMFQQMANAFEDKCYCVNLCRFGNGLNKSSRVEVRGFGNKNYTKRFITVARFVKRIETLFILSCDDDVPLTKIFSV